MHRKILFGALAALMIAGTGTYVSAQDKSPPPPPASATRMTTHGMSGMHHMDGKSDMRHGMHKRMRGHARGPAGAIISDLRHLQHLYTRQGKSTEMTSLYKHVLANTRNQEVRNYAYKQIARAQMRPANPDAAIATLRKSLDENLKALNDREQRKMARMAPTSPTSK